MSMTEVDHKIVEVDASLASTDLVLLLDEEGKDGWAFAGWLGTRITVDEEGGAKGWHRCVFVRVSKRPRDLRIKPERA